VTRLLRLFVDSNVLVGGIVSSWGLDNAVLQLCAARVCQLVLAEVVRDEVEEVLLGGEPALAAADATQIGEDFHRLLALTRPEVIPYPAMDRMRAHRHLTPLLSDAAMLLSAIESQPDWLLTHNTKHFPKGLCRRSGLRIATPAEFFQTLSSLVE
jgi:hypothetical protein